MKTYRRTEKRNGYAAITEVDDAGNYRHRDEWPDGTCTSYHKTTLAEMGWESLKTFLANRPGFVPVDQ